MAKRGCSKWALGCGIGCGVLIIIVILLGVLATVFVRRSFEEIIAAGESYKRLVTELGKPEEFVPPADGAVPADRMELFLSIRESLESDRASLETTLADFPPDDVLQGEDGFRKALKVIGSLTDLINPIGQYIDARNQALLAREMGLGEYFYIYCIAYYSWLDHSPEDGPIVRKRVPGQDDLNPGDRLFDEADSDFSPRRARRRYRVVMLSLLRNQLDSLPEAGASAEGGAWRRALEEEIARFEGNPGRRLWQGGLPPAIEASLAPYRERLEAAYQPSTNCFEFAKLEERGGANWSVRIH